MSLGMDCGRGKCGAKEKTFPREKGGPKRGWGRGKDVGQGRRHSLGGKCVPRKKGLRGREMRPRRRCVPREMGPKKEVP